MALDKMAGAACVRSKSLCAMTVESGASGRWRSPKVRGLPPGYASMHAAHAARIGRTLALAVRIVLSGDVMAIQLRNFLENWDKRFDTEELDEFRALVAATLSRQQKSLARDEASLPQAQPDEDFDVEAYRSHLEDRWHFTNDVQSLADELAIVALYNQVELHTKRVVKKNFPNIDPTKLSYINQARAVLPFTIDHLAGFVAFDELRLLNNSVKHDGKVSKQLSREFPFWVEGENLSGLGASYERIHPLVTQYVQEFVTACYAKSARSKP